MPDGRSWNPGEKLESHCLGEGTYMSPCGQHSVAQDKNPPQTGLRDLLPYITEQCRSRVRVAGSRGYKDVTKTWALLVSFSAFLCPASSSGRLFSCKDRCSPAAPGVGLASVLPLPKGCRADSPWTLIIDMPSAEPITHWSQGIDSVDWPDMVMFPPLRRGRQGEYHLHFMREFSKARRERTEGKTHRGLLRFICISSYQNVLPRLPPSAASHGNWLEMQVHRPRPRPTEWKKPSPTGHLNVWSTLKTAQVNQWILHLTSIRITGEILSCLDPTHNQFDQEKGGDSPISEWRPRLKEPLSSEGRLFSAFSNLCSGDK